MLSKINIREIIDRCESATKGPWTQGGSGRYINGFELFEEVHLNGDEEAMVCDTHSTVGGIEAHKKTACFIAHSRQDIPELLEHIKDQDAIIDQLRERLERAKRRG
tara:strand:+ start:165 stop:482 length:318 start_codon:yes stop_codon:yes gene_type:complete